MERRPQFKPRLPALEPVSTEFPLARAFSDPFIVARSFSLRSFWSLRYLARVKRMALPIDGTAIRTDRRAVTHGLSFLSA